MWRHWAMYLGRALEGIGDLGGAADAYGEALTLEPEQLTLAEALVSAGYRSGAIQTHPRLVAEHRGEPIDDRSYFAPRVPVKPVRIDTLLATQDALDAQD